LVYFTAILYILWSFGIFFSCFGLLFFERSGNPAPEFALFHTDVCAYQGKYRKTTFTANMNVFLCRCHLNTKNIFNYIFQGYVLKLLMYQITN
jgi:hypothetical protein